MHDGPAVTAQSILKFCFGLLLKKLPRPNRSLLRAIWSFGSTNHDSISYSWHFSARQAANREVTEYLIKERDCGGPVDNRDGLYATLHRRNFSIRLVDMPQAQGKNLILIFTAHLN